VQKRIGIGFISVLLAVLFLGSPATNTWAHGMAGVGGFQGGFHSSGGGVQGNFGGFQGRAMQPGFQGSFAPSRTQGFSSFQRFQPGQVFAPQRPIVNRFPGRFPTGIFFGSPFFPNGSQIVVINAPSYEIPSEQQCGPDAHWDATTGQCRRNTAPSASPAQFFFPSGVIVLRPGGRQEQADSCPEEFVEQIQKGVRFCVDPEHPESIPPR